jgi:hypothetical protein
MPVPIASTSLLPLVGRSVGAKDLVSFNEILGRVVPEDVVGLFDGTIEDVVGLFDGTMPGLVLTVGDLACIVRFAFNIGVWIGLDDTTGINDGSSPEVGEFDFSMSAVVGDTDFFIMLGLVLPVRIIAGA